MTQFICRHAISLDELEQCRKAQKLDLKPGDILLIRTGPFFYVFDQIKLINCVLVQTGHMVAYASASDERKQAVANTSPAAFAGVRQEKRVLEVNFLLQYLPITPGLKNCLLLHVKVDLGQQVRSCRW